jgi:hypothetical protein
LNRAIPLNGKTAKPLRKGSPSELAQAEPVKPAFASATVSKPTQQHFDTLVAALEAGQSACLVRDLVVAAGFHRYFLTTSS